MSLATPLPTGSRRELRRMKAVASVLLAVAAALYVASYLVHGRGVGFLRAATEAAMVGGLADWFAITALFRRPLGLPIPHTALVPTRKDALARSLGGFMTQTFLTPANVTARVAEAQVPRRVAAWLADPGNARRVGAEAGALAVALTDAVDREQVADLLLATARTDAARRGYAPLLGRLLQTTVEDDAHQALTGVALRGTHQWMVDNRVQIADQVRAWADVTGLLASLYLTSRRADRLVGALVDTVAAAAADDTHPVRRLIDRFLLSTARELQSDDALGRRVNAEALRVLDDPALREWLVEVLEGLAATLRAGLVDQDGETLRRLAATLRGQAQRVLDDDELRGRLDHVLIEVVRYAVDHYADEFTALVVSQVERWDGAETARRIELLAGRDLQFIRINGTVVGALAGVVIHAVSLLLP